MAHMHDRARIAAACAIRVTLQPGIVVSEDAEMINSSRHRVASQLVATSISAPLVCRLDAGITDRDVRLLQLAGCWPWRWAAGGAEASLKALAGLTRLAVASFISCWTSAQFAVPGPPSGERATLGTETS